MPTVPYALNYGTITNNRELCHNTRVEVLNSSPAIWPDQRLANETEVPVHLVDAPLECVVLGAGRCIEAYDSLKVMFMGSNR